MGGPYKERKRPDRDSAGVCTAALLSLLSGLLFCLLLRFGFIHFQVTGQAEGLIKGQPFSA